ncbi:MAG: arginase family protein [Alphaproteobacteria bacterium]|nr:arginase family protein [Alphaproteobacteria bacterium]
MTKFLGIEYGRGCLHTAIADGPALAPRAVQKMFPNHDWSFITAAPFDAVACSSDRFGENFQIQQQIYANTPTERHIMIGGDHSVNFGHFAALRDQIPSLELCLIYIDAHLDIHTPETAVSQASGAPHGTNVRALMGNGDKRWLGLQKNFPALRPENVFYLGTRSYEPAEIEFAQSNDIFIRHADQLKSESDWIAAAAEIRNRIGNRPFVVSLDFDAIDPSEFHDVLVPAENGLCTNAVKYFIREFHDAYSFEFVEYAPTGDIASQKIVRDIIELVTRN